MCLSLYFLELSGDSSAPLRSQVGYVSDTPSKVRPTNPTPGHAIGGGTPTKVRPENPTPFAAEAQPRGVRPSKCTLLGFPFFRDFQFPEKRKIFKKVPGNFCRA